MSLIKTLCLELTYIKHWWRHLVYAMSDETVFQSTLLKQLDFTYETIRLFRFIKRDNFNGSNSAE